MDLEEVGNRGKVQRRKKKKLYPDSNHERHCNNPESGG
jgi:hypothetical protein